MNQLAVFQEKFNHELDIFFTQKIKSAQKIDSKAVQLYKIAEEAVKRGGKRLRPALFYSAYSSFKQKDQQLALSMSLFLELFHSAGLIHDDILDDADQRRGGLTVYKEYGLSTAVLVGDLTFNLADEVFFNQLEKFKLSPEKKELIYLTYNEFKQEVQIGQYFDSLKIEDMEKIMEYKTARYSFMKPVQLGLLIAEVDQAEIEKWRKPLNVLGKLFQIKDDFLGTFGNSQLTGKDIKSDFKEGKRTLITKLVAKYFSDDERKKFQQLFGNKNITDNDFIWYLDVLKKHKIDSQIKELIEKKFLLFNKDYNELTKQRNDLAEIINVLISKINDFS